MRIFTAAIVTETNTFSPIPTGLHAFAGAQHGRHAPIVSATDLATMVRWRELGQSQGHTVVESIAAVAEPAGLTVASVYEALRAELLDDLRDALPVDLVLLYLHGAMAAQNCLDCEGDILARVREIAGPTTVIGAELDLHSHLTPAMLWAATLLIAYNEYPHTDIVARGEQLYNLGVAAARGETRPVMAAYDCRMAGMFPTTARPMRALVDEMKGAEREGVLALSLIHGFPWGDVPDAGTKCLAIADGDEELARASAERFGRALWDIREQALLRATSIDEALDAVVANAGRPVVLADVADNAGGGAPGDSTFILRRILERKITNAVSGVYYDPGAVALCFEAGVGATLDLRCGGKLGTASGAPVDLRVTVRGLREQHEQESMDDSDPVPFGPSAWVEHEGVHLVLASVRGQVFAPDAFTGLGIPLSGARAIVVKSSHHFYGKFAPLASQVLYVSTPGALQVDFDRIGYTRRSLNYWPRVADPFVG